ncbi:unnamed protein product [Rhizoctonia solani]|uniref:Uncharacterized protein n=1 Tax=Rhizoctonia solani TaxID=456999 RepID=A0A8H3GW68_9AGAM|nr:unnamed protein product [Rhizoctonia solani]
MLPRQQHTTSPPPSTSQSEAQQAPTAGYSEIPVVDNGRDIGLSGQIDSETKVSNEGSVIEGSSNVAKQPPENLNNIAAPPEDPLSAIPNLFRLLDLVDEHASGGIIERVVIDQHSLHSLLNIVQPGSYDSVSKINFRSLDQLAIKPTGVYGNRSEIVEFLRRTQFLDQNSAGLLSRASSPDDSSSGLKSGLYLVLDPDHHDLGPSKSAYVIYWPEDTT